jgi:hypothetical protein
LSGPRSLGEVVDMVMYKQGSGLVAGGTIGQQSTGGIMSPKKPQYSVQSMDDGGFKAGGLGSVISGAAQGVGSFIQGLGNIGVLGGQSRGNIFTYTPPGSQSQQPKAPPMPSAPMMAPKDTRQFTSDRFIPLAQEMAKRGMPLTGRETYDDLERLYGQYVPRVTQAQVAQAPNQARAEAAAGQQFIGPGFTMPTRSAFEDLVNPYDEIYKGGLMSAAGGRVARQFAPGRERLQQDLAARGISPDSPLFMSMMAQGADREDAARGAAIEQAMLEGAGRQAEFDRFKATGRADWARAGAELAMRQERQPGELSMQEQQVRSAAIENDLRAIGLEQARDPRVRQAMVDDILNKSGLNALERQAAERAFRESDPENPWNWRVWGAIAGGIDALEKISRIPKNLAGIGSGGK